MTNYTWKQNNHFYKEANYYLLEEQYRFKIKPDGLINMCVAGEEARSIMWHCHNSTYGSHHN